MKQSHKLLALLVFGLPLSATAETPDLPGPVTPLQETVSLGATFGWQSACVLRQDVTSEGREHPAQFVTFDTWVEGAPGTPILVQVVRGRDGKPDGPVTFGYEHRLTLSASGVPVAAEARAIDGFPIAADVLHDAAASGRVDIRDAIFSGRSFGQDTELNASAEATFRFLAPVMPQGTRLRELVDHKDRTKVAGLITLGDGSQGLALAIDATATTVRRSGVTEVTMDGWLVLHRESGLIAGEAWTASVLKSTSEPFDLTTKITCDVSRRTAR